MCGICGIKLPEPGPIGQNLVAIEAAAVRTTARALGEAGDVPVEAGRIVLRRRAANLRPVRAALSSLTASGSTAFRMVLFLSLFLSGWSIWLRHRDARWTALIIAEILTLVALVTITVVRGVNGRREPRLILSPDGVEVPDLKLRAPWSAFDRADVTGNDSCQTALSRHRRRARTGSR